MRILIATTALLVIAGLIGAGLAGKRHHKALAAVSVAALLVSTVLVVGMVAFPRETCELMGGNLTGYDTGSCVNELGGTSAGGIG